MGLLLLRQFLCHQMKLCLLFGLKDLILIYNCLSDSMNLIVSSTTRHYYFSITDPRISYFEKSYISRHEVLLRLSGVNVWAMLIHSSWDLSSLLIIIIIIITVIWTISTFKYPEEKNELYLYNSYYVVTVVILALSMLEQIIARFTSPKMRCFCAYCVKTSWSLL